MFDADQHFAIENSNFMSFNCIYLLTGLWIGPWSGLWYLKKIEKLRKKRSEKKRKKEEKNVDGEKLHHTLCRNCIHKRL